MSYSRHAVHDDHLALGSGSDSMVNFKVCCLFNVPLVSRMLQEAQKIQQNCKTETLLYLLAPPGLFQV